MASKIARGVSVEEATDEIVESTYFAAIRAGKEKEWNWAKEVHAVMRMGFDFINKHPEYRNRLPEDLEGPFSEKFIAGHEPKIVCAPHIGWHVRGKWGSAAGITPANGVSRISPPDASSVGQPAVGAAGSKTLVVHTWTVRDPTTFPRRQWLYGKHYLRRTTSLTAGPGGMGKSSLLLVEACAMAMGTALVPDLLERQRGLVLFPMVAPLTHLDATLLTLRKRGDQGFPPWSPLNTQTLHFRNLAEGSKAWPFNVDLYVSGPGRGPEQVKA